MSPPAFDQDLGFLQRVEELSVQKLIPELPIERLHVTVLPGTPRLDGERLHTELAKPVPHRRRRKLRTVVRADVVWQPSPQEEIE